MALDIRRVIESIEKYEPVDLTAYKVPSSSIAGIGKILELYLRKIKLQKYYFQFFYAVRELVENAKKANLKRVYFKQNNLDLNNPDHYQQGMQKFKDEVYSKISEYENLLKESGLYVRTTFEVDETHFYITITNNVHISSAEEARINDRLSRSQSFTSVEEAFQTVLDSSEGAGLGIVMLVLMLRKIGLDHNAFSIQGVNGTTMARVRIPRHDLVIQRLSDLTGRISEELERIPQFPEHIQALQRLIADPEVDFGRIERTISMDPGLAAEILRMVNSAAFGIHRRVKTISEAVSLMGLKGIRDMITACGTVKLMVDRYGEMQKLWNHCYRVAVYASVIARRYSLRKIYEVVYSSSLLHDLGRVLVDFLSPDLFDKLRRFSVEKNIPPEEFELFVIGTHHAEVGALMAERWEYPEAITETIRHHHTPDACREKYKELVQTVYLANFLDDWDRGRAVPDHLSPEVMNRFSLHNTDTLQALLLDLKKQFKRIAESQN
ncbi:HDOD domain-containing protein [Marispirochaeta sp.]|uniref:HDOD domain-containing protein n=1 Tax=Marispirochaeta sp. TaxID=2038653 RepID=UPI0029C6932B|nr:HDOD domain-containing protein [Marispirochaeta sp.]